MTTKMLDTIAMTRHIRDALYEEIKDKSVPERLAFYRDQARAFHHKLGIDEPAEPVGKSGSAHRLVATEQEHQHHES